MLLLKVNLFKVVLKKGLRVLEVVFAKHCSLGCFNSVTSFQITWTKICGVFTHI